MITIKFSALEANVLTEFQELRLRVILKSDEDKGLFSASALSAVIQRNIVISDFTAHQYEL